MWWLLLPISHAAGPLFGERLLGLRVLQNVPWKYFKDKDVKGSSPCLGVKVPWGEFVGLETVVSGQDLMVHLLVQKLPEGGAGLSPSPFHPWHLPQSLCVAGLPCLLGEGTGAVWLRAHMLSPGAR